MALKMGKKMKNNHLLIEYLGGVSGNLRKGKEFIALATEELQSHQEVEEKQDESVGLSGCGTTHESNHVCME